MARTTLDPVQTGAAPRRRRGRRLLGVAVVLVLVTALAALSVNLTLTSKLERIDGAFDGLGERPASASGDTILMVGTRPGGDSDVPWLAGRQSLEAIMLVEIRADAESVAVETVPSAANLGGSATSARPSEMVGAVEQWSGRHVDHLMAVDWRTFAKLGARDGVDATYAYGSAPPAQHAYLQVVLENTLQTAMRSRPWQVYGALSTAAEGTAVDDEWSFLELDWLVLRMRDLRSHDIRFSIARSRQ